MLLGNKLDMESARKVPVQVGEKLAKVGERFSLSDANGPAMTSLLNQAPFSV